MGKTTIQTSMEMRNHAGFTLKAPNLSSDVTIKSIIHGPAEMLLQRIFLVLPR